MKSTNLICNVKFIDDTCQKFTVPRKAYGSLLMNLIKTHLSLRECIYFGLYHIGQYLFSQKNSFLPDQEIKWMNLNKPLRKQFSEKIFYLQFAVKYYIEFPYLIQDESVMYNYFLQCKKNLLTNKYSSISFNDHVYLTSLAIHSDYGDFGFNSVNMEEVKSTFFLSSFQDFDAVRRQSEHLTGTPPHISEQQFLKIISDFDDYAFWKFPIRNSADNIGHIYVNFAGIIVYSFQFKPIPLKWTEIAKLNFKKRVFSIEVNSKIKMTYELENCEKCKKLWQCCVDNHRFFRLQNIPSNVSLFDFNESNFNSQATLANTSVCSNIVDNFATNYSRSIEDVEQIEHHSTHSLPTFNKRLRDTDEETISKKITYTGISSTMNHLESHSFRDKTRNAKPINDISQSVSEKPIMNVEIQMNQNKIKSHPKIPKSTSVKEHISSNSTTNLSSTSSSSDKPIFYEFDSSKIEKTKKSFTLSSSSVRRENGPFHINIRNKQSYIEESNQNKESITLPESINLIKEMLDKCEDYTLYKSIFRFKPGMTNSSAFHPKNITKNRYRDVYPYDSTRVVLNSKLYCKSLPKEIPFKNCIKKVIDTISKLSSDSETECKASFEIPLVSSPKELHSDKMYGYINASYVTMKITKSGVVNRYIAAQGPLKSTVLDFWQMIWNEKSSLVVMLTQCYEKNKKKCYKYWSDDNNVFNIGSFNITLESCTTMNGYIYRIFTIINADQMPQESNVRQVVHLQYTSWPDHGVPTDFDNFIQFIQVVREEKKGILENTIVHCSAGIGRSGVLIMMDTVMCLIEANQPIFPINIVKEMRCCRALMIQTDIQFNFTCKALVHVYENKIVQPIDTFIDKPESV